MARYRDAFSEPTYKKTFIGSKDWLAASADITSVLIAKIDNKRNFGVDATRPEFSHGWNKLPAVYGVTDRVIEKRATALQFGADNISAFADSCLDVDAHRGDF